MDTYKKSPKSDEIHHKVIRKIPIIINDRCSEVSHPATETTVGICFLILPVCRELRLVLLVLGMRYISTKNDE